MNLLRVSAASILLAGFSAVSAQESVEPGLERGWANDIQDDSSLMGQANVVLASLRPELVPETVLANVDAGPDPEPGNGSSGCIFMERPGSRIRETRCYYPTEGEQALNDYQFSEEIRLMRQQQAILDMMRAEAEANRLGGMIR